MWGLVTIKIHFVRLFVYSIINCFYYFSSFAALNKTYSSLYYAVPKFDT